MDINTAQLYCQHAISLPRIVTGPGLYRTRSGETVTVDRFNGYNGFMAEGSYENGPAESWFISGRVLSHYLSKNDIIQAL
jgi:hypothetical protein